MTLCLMYARDHEGEVIVYQWIENIREYITNTYGMVCAYVILSNFSVTYIAMLFICSWVSV